MIIKDGFLLSRVCLHFEEHEEDLLHEISSTAISPDGHLWLGSDEYLSLERLTPLSSCVYGNHQSYPLKDYIDLYNKDDEIDIEGMDCDGNYIWLTGSHSTKRKKPKGDDSEEAINRLATVKQEKNRYIFARIPIKDGELYKSLAVDGKELTAGTFKKVDDSNVLLDALKDDPHLGIFFGYLMASKENGFDIEGLAVEGKRVFLGLRGPVLRGHAVILEFQPEEENPGELTLKPIGDNGELYFKHFVYLQGNGVRELCIHNGDLIILSGPTMDLEGSIAVYKLKKIKNLKGNTFNGDGSKKLEYLFNLPFRPPYDHAEGLDIIPCLGFEDGLFVVYDSPHPSRMVGKKQILADIYHL